MAAFRQMPYDVIVCHVSYAILIISLLMRHLRRCYASLHTEDASSLASMPLISFRVCHAQMPADDCFATYIFRFSDDYAYAAAYDAVLMLLLMPLNRCSI